MKLKEIYEPLRPLNDDMDMVDVKIYQGMDGEVKELLLKYVPGQGKEKAVREKRPFIPLDEDKI